MKRINIFKQHLNERKAIKVISGMMNLDAELVKKVVYSAEYAKASAVDVACDEKIINIAKETTNLPVFVSSLSPEKLVKAIDFGADAIEIGNYETLYKKGIEISSKEVIKIVEKTIELLGSKEIFMSVTVPGDLETSEQIKLAQRLEELGADLIQTEGSSKMKITHTGARGLIQMSEVSIANTVEIARAVNIPIMTSSGISALTAPMAFAAGASAIGVGNCINKCDNLLSMLAASKAIVESVNKLHINNEIFV